MIIERLQFPNNLLKWWLQWHEQELFFVLVPWPSSTPWTNIIACNMTPISMSMYLSTTPIIIICFLFLFFHIFFAHHTSIRIYLLFLSRAGKSFKISARRNVVIPKCHQKCLIFDKNTEFKNIKRGIICIIISKVFSLFINVVLLYPQSSIADPQS